MTAHIVGYKHQLCGIGYDIYYVNGQLAQRGEHTLTSFKPASDDDTGGATLVIPKPQLPGQYYVQFVLFAPNDSMLDTEQANFNIS